MVPQPDRLEDQADQVQHEDLNVDHRQAHLAVQQVQVQAGPPGAGPTRGPTRGPPGAGPTRGPPGGPARGPDPRGPARGGPSQRSPAQGKKVVAKRKLVGSEAKARAKVTIDPDLFDDDEMEDRTAAVDWTRTALKGGVSERSILMQLQTTGWSAPQSRAIIDLSKQ